MKALWIFYQLGKAHHLEVNSFSCAWSLSSWTVFKNYDGPVHPACSYCQGGSDGLNSLLLSVQKANSECAITVFIWWTKRQSSRLSQLGMVKLASEVQFSSVSITCSQQVTQSPYSPLSVEKEKRSTFWGANLMLFIFTLSWSMTSTPGKDFLNYLPWREYLHKSLYLLSTGNKCGEKSECSLFAPFRINWAQNEMWASNLLILK